MKDKAIMTAVITGSIHTTSMSKYLPMTPQEIADEAVRAHEAGVAICHIHVCNPETGQPISDINLSKETSLFKKKRRAVCYLQEKIIRDVWIELRNLFHFTKKGERK